MAQWFGFITISILCFVSMLASQVDAAQQTSAMVRIVHAAPDTTPVDVLVDNKVVLKQVGFATITNYLELTPGDHRVALTPAGQDATAAIISTELTVDANKAYTVVAVGLQNVNAQVFTDDLSPPPSGKARVRLIHTSPDAPGVDVEVINGPTLFQNVKFGEASAYQEVDAGTYNLRAITAGANTVVVQLPNTTVDAGTVYDVIPVGRLANIQVVVGAFTPSVQPTTSSSSNNGQQPAGPVVMASTGISDSYGVLLGVAGLAFVGGVLLRRYTAI